MYSWAPIPHSTGLLTCGGGEKVSRVDVLVEQNWRALRALSVWHSCHEIGRFFLNANFWIQLGDQWMWSGLVQIDRLPGNPESSTPNWSGPWLHGNIPSWPASAMDLKARGTKSFHTVRKWVRLSIVNLVKSCWAKVRKVVKKTKNWLGTIPFGQAAQAVHLLARLAGPLTWH